MISLCMIVKDEEETLALCLESVKQYVDEIIVVDTGSTDDTIKIAEQYTENIYNFIWCNDFGKARNFSISKANYDWILILDADEIIENFNSDSIKKFCNKDANIVGRIKRINIFESQNGITKYKERVNRFFNKNYYRYEGIIHEQIVNNDTQEYITENVEIIANHVGYSLEVLNRTSKVRRNIDLLNEAITQDDTDPYLYYQLGKSYFLSKEYCNAYKYFRKSLNLLNKFEYEYAQDLIECYGYSMLNGGMFEEALELYEYEKYYRNSADFIFLLALIEMNNEKFQKAAELFLKCTSFEDGKVDGITTFIPLYNIGVIFECLGFKAEAIEYFKMCKGYKSAQERLNVLKD